MENENKKFTEWIKEHKKELIIAGISIAAITAVLIGIKHRESIEEIWKTFSKTIKKTAEDAQVVETEHILEVEQVRTVVETRVQQVSKASHVVAEHLRDFPNGWHASSEKIATAFEHGYELREGQTWVKSYRTGGLAA